MARAYPREVIIEYLEKYITDDYKEFDNDSGDWININSTVTSDNKHRMGISVSDNYVNDFKTGYHNSFVKFVAENQDISEKEADILLFKIQMNQRKNGFVQTKIKKKIDNDIAIELEEIKDHTPWRDLNKDSLRNKLGRQALSYLIHRGFSVDHIKKYHLKYVDQKECWVCHGYKTINNEECDNCKGTGLNFYYGRIIVPTFENRKLVYFQARSFQEDGKYKYMNPKIGRKQVAFFIDLVKEREPVYICEGPFDAMTLKDVSATCLMGSVISIPQALKIINKKPSEIIIVPDHDEKKETRSVILNNVMKNIKKLKALSDNKIPIGVYQWYKNSDKKDINSAGITTIDESLVVYANKSIKGESLIS